MDNKAIDVSALTKKARKCQQFLNFIRQNWIAIALNIATVVICALSIQYGLSRPFDWAPSSLIMAICIIVIAGSIGGALKSTNMIIHICLMIIAAAGATTGAIFGFEYLRVIIHDEYILWPLCYVCGTIGALMGILSGYLVMCCTHNFINTLWEQHKKYCLSIVLAIVTLTVLLASSFQNVDARSWKFDRGTGKLVERVVFIWPGSTLEKEYFVVDRKPQKEVSVWIWFPAVEDSGWSYEKKGYSFRGEVVLTYKFKNYQAYKMIHGIQFPELPMLAKSRAQAPGYIMSGVLSYIGLTSGDVEIIKIDGLEGSRGLSAD